MLKGKDGRFLYLFPPYSMLHVDPRAIIVQRQKCTPLLLSGIFYVSFSSLHSIDMLATNASYKDNYPEKNVKVH
jgi:hypothetical protein